ncbi:unnamed protein product [Rhizophagus irregularis]|nr:unnamed protein product [Rhizophagus irregularis]CAB5362485.1 unnamed protein product [Rhizophagus irregularis]
MNYQQGQSQEEGIHFPNMNIISLPGINVSLATTPQGQNNVNFGGVEETNFGSHLGSNISFITTQCQNNVNSGGVEEEEDYMNFGSHLGSNTSFVTTQGQNFVNSGGVEEEEEEEEDYMIFGSHIGSNTSFVTTQVQNDVNSGGVEEEEDYMIFDSLLGSNTSFSQVQDQNNVDFVSIPVPNTHFGTQLYNQVHNLGDVVEHSVNTSFPPDLIETHPQNQTQQSLSNQLFQPSPNITALYTNVQPVADGSVGQFLNQPELFTERGSSTFCANDYKKKQHKEVVRQLTSNHGCVKRGLWENISSALSQHGHKNFSPPQCANKWKNIKQDYKKNSEYQYKSEVDSILGNNWHKSDIF